MMMIFNQWEDQLQIYTKESKVNQNIYNTLIERKLTILVLKCKALTLTSIIIMVKVKQQTNLLQK